MAYDCLTMNCLQPCSTLPEIKTIGHKRRIMREARTCASDPQNVPCTLYPPSRSRNWKRTSTEGIFLWTAPQSVFESTASTAAAQARQRKETNRRKHSKPGTMDHVPMKHPGQTCGFVNVCQGVIIPKFVATKLVGKMMMKPVCDLGCALVLDRSRSFSCDLME